MKMFTGSFRSKRPFRLVMSLLAASAFGAILVGSHTPSHAAALREHTVSIIYERQYVYGGRLINSKVAFEKLQEFFEGNPFAEQPYKTYSFLADVLKNTMLPRQGYVMTQYGFGYGACGAPSLLNELVATATFMDSDGTENPVFEAVAWTRERNPTYGPYGVAIYLDPEGKRTRDYRWRLNAAYDGPPPQITVSFEETGKDSAMVTLSMRYADELPRPERSGEQAEMPQ